MTSIREKVTNNCNIHCCKFAIVVLTAVGKVFIAMEGIEPYVFEPVRQDTAEEEPDDASSESDKMENAGDTKRVGNVSWCTCGSSCCLSRLLS